MLALTSPPTCQTHLNDMACVRPPGVAALAVVLVALVLLLFGLVSLVLLHATNSVYPSLLSVVDYRGSGSVDPTATSQQSRLVKSSVPDGQADPHLVRQSSLHYPPRMESHDSRLSSHASAQSAAQALLSGVPGSAHGATRHFCPELVVPRVHEAVLVVPADQSSFIQVRDLEGKPVICAQVNTNSGHDPIVVLHAAAVPGGPTQGKALAYCRLLERTVCHSPRSCAEIIDSRNKLCAMITKVTSHHLLTKLWNAKEGPLRPGMSLETFRTCFVLSPVGEASTVAPLLFTGNFIEHGINVMNEKKETVADTVPATMHFDKTGLYYNLRVTSKGDVGLVLCALLAMGALETKP